MAILYALGRTLESQHPAWGFLRAFAEAGMVGALADWFAVVALFRHPLGMSWIPHTAIIPRRKNQIGDNLAKFVQEHFLGPAQITARLAKVNLSEKLAVWCSAPGHAESVANKIAEGLPGLVNALGDTDMQRFLKENLLTWAQRIPLEQWGGKMLGMLTETGRHQDLLEQALRFTKTLLDDNVPMVEERIAGELEKVPGLFGLKTMFVKKTAAKIVSNIQQTLDDIVDDPFHTLRLQFDDKVNELARELPESPAWHERAETLKRELLSNEALLQSLEAVWTGLKRELLADLAREDSAVKAQITRGIREIGSALAKDPAFRDKLDGWIRDAAAYLVRSHGHEIGSLIRDTVHKWDGDELSAKLEAQVGADLQFIRINGTLVGGMVGIVLHALGLLVWH